MSRSVRVASEHIEKVQQALKRSCYPSQSAIASEVGLTRPTVSNFFNGKPVDYLNFVEISQKLGLDWQAIAARGNFKEPEELPLPPIEVSNHVAPYQPDILVVDDRPDNIRLLSTMLTERGYKVRKAVSGAMALTAVNTAIPDLILLDINMPHVDGYEVCQQLKTSEKTCGIPIIFISALDEVLDKVRAFAVGGVDYITKPFHLEEVIARVDSQLTICRLQEQMESQNHILQTEIESRLEIDRTIQEQNILLQKEVQSRLKVEKLLQEQNLMLQREIQNRQLAEKKLQEKNIQLHQEIQDHILTERHLLEKDQQLEALIANIPGVVYRAISHIDGRVSMPYISPRLKEMFGISRQDFTETFEWIFDLAHPEDRVNLSEIVETSIQNLTPFSYEYRLPSALGGIRWVKIFAKTYKAENGDVIWDGVIINITEQKNIDITIQDKEQQLEALIDNIPGIVYRAIANRHGNVAMTYISHRVEEIFGINREEFAETFEWIFDVVHPEDRTNLQDLVTVSIQNLAPFEYAYRLPHKHGEVEWVRIFARPYNDVINQNIIWDGVVMDITQQKKMEIVYENLLDLLQNEYAQSEQLLLSLFPHQISESLKHNRQPIAQSFDAVSVLFADIVGFTEIASQLSPTETVELLNRIFSSFDRLAENHHLEKIKTIGDAYMVVAGVPDTRTDHAKAIAEMALDLQTEITKFTDSCNQPMSLRIGINTGAIVAGVIGSNKFAYDIWGDTVNIASRMESQGESGKIQISEATYNLLKDQYIFSSRGNIAIKGKGEMTTYWLLGKIK